MNLQFFIVETKDRMATVKLNRPPANALGLAVLEELARVVTELEENPSIKAVVVAAHGRHFCAGADIRELEQIATAEDARAFAQRGQRLFNRIEALNKPVLAAISGACLGGGLELAMACHIRIAAHDGLFGLPELNLGIIPGFGGTQRLPRLVGSAKALELILTGNTVSADEAMAIGLVNEVQLRSELLSRAHDLAETIACKGIRAIHASLQAVRWSSKPPSEQDLEREAALFAELFRTHDAKEGLRAFLEKRSPHFTDR